MARIARWNGAVAYRIAGPSLAHLHAMIAAQTSVAYSICAWQTMQRIASGAACRRAAGISTPQSMHRP